MIQTYALISAYFNFLDFMLIALQQIGMSAAAIRTGLSIRHRAIGFFAALAEGDGWNCLNFQFTSIHQ